MIGTDRFSSSADSYIYLKSGEEVIGKIEDIDRKKGLIEEIELELQNGDEVKFVPEDIDYMYLKPSGFDKIGKGLKHGLNVDEDGRDRTVSLEKLKDGYVLFETTEVMLKKKKRTLLMQLVNPGYSSKIRVYFDPYARESMSVGIKGFTIAGGQDKSYFVKIGDAPAEKIKSKNYDDAFQEYYKSCPTLLRKYKKKDGWSNFSEHVYYFDTECE